jgi:hypothetical protein
VCEGDEREIVAEYLAAHDIVADSQLDPADSA